MKINRFFNFLFPITVVVGLMFIGCTKGKTAEPIVPCDPNKVYFARDIQPLLNANCAMGGCHDAATARDGVNLSSYEGVMKIVKAGNASASKLYEVITETKESDRMPPAPAAALTAAQIALINTWITEGAKNNACLATNSCSFTAVSFSADVRPIINANCTGGCHSAVKLDGGYDFSNYSGIKSAADNEVLYLSIAHLSGASPMPQGGNKLSDCDIKKIKAWMDAGAENN